MREPEGGWGKDAQDEEQTTTAVIPYADPSNERLRGAVGWYHCYSILQMRRCDPAGGCKGAFLASSCIHPPGLCGGLGDPHRLASQLLPGGQAHL